MHYSSPISLEYNEPCVHYNNQKGEKALWKLCLKQRIVVCHICKCKMVLYRSAFRKRALDPYEIWCSCWPKLTTHSYHISWESNEPFVRYDSRNALRKLRPQTPVVGWFVGSEFRASSAVSKRLDGFLSNLVGRWTPVIRRCLPNFVPIRWADRLVS